jgi:hydrogenase maturation protein HypF
MATRVQIQVRGLVQGVGFRPFVFSLAGRLALRGRVFNNGAGVLIDVEGDGRAVERFIAEVESNPPALSVIESVERFDNLEPANYRDFRIIESASSGEKFAPVPADVATCDDCFRELFDPRDRRYRYPFINCSNCGPRFTIIEDIPYDRAKTTMREFAMCRDCRVEYENIGMLDRDELRIGDYVLIHVEFAMSKVDEKEAEATLRLLQDLGSYEAEVAQDEIH